MTFQFNDGGRSEAGYKGDTRDCVTRSIAIATGKPYQIIYDALNACAEQPVARTGVKKHIYNALLLNTGWTWTPTMKIGSGCKVHLKADELPSGRLIVKVSKHLVAVIDGVIHDTYDCSRNGTRCVYGYWKKEAVK